jgi:hypothetical protein
MEFQYLNTRENKPAQTDRQTSIIISNICTVPTEELMLLHGNKFPRERIASELLK